MPDYGYTVSPVISEGPTGDQVVDFSVDDGNARNGAIQEFEQEQSGLHYVDEWNQQRHRLSALEEADSRSLDPYQEPEQLQQSDFDAHQLPPQDIAYLQDQVGGAAAYNQLTEWAATYFSDDVINAYDDVMSRGNIEEMEQCVQALFAEYRNVTSEIDRRYDETEEITDDLDLQDNYAAAYSLTGGKSNYQALITYAANNWDQQAIDMYDQIMNSGDTERISATVQLLIDDYRRNN